MLEDAKLAEEDVEEATGARSWGTRFSVDGDQFVASLFWQPLQNKDDPYTEVGEAADGILEGADLFCLKGGKAPQFGICVSGEGYKAGEFSAAVALATSLGNLASFVAVFKVDGGWWYTCIRNDIILSDGDMLFLNEDDAKSQLLSMLAVPDWGMKITPPEWEIDDTEYPDLGDLLRRGAHVKLEKIKALRGAKLALLFLGLGVGGLLVLWLLVDWIMTPAKKPIIAPVAPKVRPVEKPPEIKPWEQIPDPSIVMSECFTNTRNLLSIMPPGWAIGQISCTPGGASATWSIEVGRIAWINQAMTESGLKLGGRSVSDDGRTFSVSYPLSTPAKQITSPPMVSTAELRKTMNDLFQALGLTITMINDTFVSPEQNTYRSVKFNIKSDQNPLVWLDLLINFSGLQIYTIKYTTKTDIWEYEGAIHVL